MSAKEKKTKDEFVFKCDCPFEFLAVGDYFKMKPKGVICKIKQLLPRRAICLYMNDKKQVFEFVLPLPVKETVMKFFKQKQNLLFH